MDLDGAEDGDGASPDLAGGRRIGLVGCVKAKGDVRTVAADLYRSPLFLGRRRFVEASCDEWWILSALHGLVDPVTELSPYDQTLTAASAQERRRWASRVLGQIDDTISLRRGDVAELHCGGAYRGHGLVVGLEERGATVENPTAGLGIGRQLRLYAGFGE